MAEKKAETTEDVLVDVNEDVDGEEVTSTDDVNYVEPATDVAELDDEDDDA